MSFPSVDAKVFIQASAASYSYGGLLTILPMHGCAVHPMVDLPAFLGSSPGSALPCTSMRDPTLLLVLGLDPSATPSCLFPLSCL